MKLVKPPEKKTPVGPNTKPVNKNKPVVETKPAKVTKRISQKGSTKSKNREAEKTEKCKICKGSTD